MDECMKLLEKEVAKIEINLERAKQRNGVLAIEIQNLEWKLAVKRRLIAYLKERLNPNE